MHISQLCAGLCQKRNGPPVSPRKPNKNTPANVTNRRIQTDRIEILLISATLVLDTRIYATVLRI